MRRQGHYLRALYQLKAAGSLNMHQYVVNVPAEEQNDAAGAFSELMELPEVAWDGKVDGTLTWSERGTR